MYRKGDFAKVCRSGSKYSKKITEEQLKTQAVAAWMELEKCLKNNPKETIQKGVKANGRNITESQVSNQR